MRLRRFIAVAVGLPLAILMVLFAVANRQPVRVGLDPFSPNAPALAVDAPLFAVFFVALLAGVVIGGVAAWTRQGRARREAKRLRQENDRLESETEQARREAAAARRVSLPAPSSRAA